MVTFLIGLLVGLVLAPVLRSWILWRQYRSASRQAASAEAALRRLERDEPRRDPAPVAR
jgi:ABC-type transport system involved in cytochrome bd biosynthesis fused ATPase/permease subunit